MRGSIIRYMYYQIGNELLNQELIPCIPDYKTIHNNRSYGLIVQRYDGFAYIGINTSIFNPDFQHSWNELKWFRLIETICHEFAHINEWEHGSKHTKLTFDYILIAYELLLKDDNLNKRSAFIDSFKVFKNSQEFKAFFDVLLKPTEKVVNKSNSFNFDLDFYVMSCFLFAFFILEIIYFITDEFSFIRPPPGIIFN